MRKIQRAIFFLTPGILMRFLAKKCENIAKSRQKMIPAGVYRDLINSRFGVSYSNFSFLTPTFWKVSIDKYGKTPTFSGGQHFTPIFKILVRTLVYITFLFLLKNIDCGYSSDRLGEAVLTNTRTLCFELK